MGKPYGHQYFGKNSGCMTGTMICSGCGKPIKKKQAFRSYKKSKSYDWSYITHHKHCCEDDPKWAKIDRENQKHRDKYNKIVGIMQKAAEDIGETDPYSFARIACDALDGDDLDDHYFSIYGSC